MSQEHTFKCVKLNFLCFIFSKLWSLQSYLQIRNYHLLAHWLTQVLLHLIKIICWVKLLPSHYLVEFDKYWSKSKSDYQPDDDETSRLDRPSTNSSVKVRRLICKVVEAAESVRIVAPQVCSKLHQGHTQMKTTPRTLDWKQHQGHIPHNCYGRCPCKFFLPGVIFSRLNAKKVFTV